MKARILNIGDEVLSGRVINTNSSFISSSLRKIGITTEKVIVTSDNEQEIINELENFKNSDSKIIITTGGLGPTHDDLTKEVICSFLNLELEISQDEIRKIEIHFNHKMPKSNYKQALIPKNCHVLVNDIGTAPGFIIENNDKTYILLVGPPFEMEPMFDKAISYLQSKLQNEILLSEYIVMGTCESKVEDVLKEYYKLFNNVSICPYASLGKVRYQITSSVLYEKEYNKACELFEKLFDEFIISKNNESIEDVIINSCIKNKITLSVAESITGGMIVAKLINVSGSSNVIKESYITYSDEAKINILSINKEFIDKHGVVSKEVAIKMAENLKEKTNSDITIGITGLAGPNGENEKNKIGTVFFAINAFGKCHGYKFIFSGNRQMVRERATMMTLYKVFRTLKSNKML